MDVEEIVALSVKHNVSDLHLCSDSPPRWRRTGRLEPAPFPSPDLGALLKAWLNDEQQGYGGPTARWILPRRWREASACAAVPLSRCAESL